MRNCPRARVALIVPWVGRRPWYWDLWLKSAAGRPFEVITVEKSAAEFKELAERKLGRSVAFDGGYKLCDLKPLYGVIFEDEFQGYDYWAFGDCDVVYGRKLDGWVEKVVAEGWDVATVMSRWTSGALTLVRNCETCNRLYERARGLDEMLSDARPFAFDEFGEKWFQRWQFGGQPLSSMQHDGWSFGSVCFSASEIRFLHEDLLCERDLKGGHRVALGQDGALTFDGEEVAMFHFIAAKATLGFGEVSATAGEIFALGIGRTRRFVDAVRFAAKLVVGNAAAWERARRVFKRLSGHKDWWR